MESDTAGDIFSTPTKTTVGAPMGVHQANAALDKSPEASPQQLQASPPRLSLGIEQDESDDTDTEYSGAMNCSLKQQLVVSPQHPTFVTVVGLLPKTIFWVMAAPIAKYSNKAYGAMFERVGGLER
jgi:hypothetical protein